MSSKISFSTLSRTTHINDERKEKGGERKNFPLTFEQVPL